jgi:hypothetical protein
MKLQNNAAQSCIYTKLHCISMSSILAKLHNVNNTFKTSYNNWKTAPLDPVISRTKHDTTEQSHI